MDPDRSGTISLPIRVGLIGYGFSGKTFHAPLIASVPGLTLAAVASSDAAKVRADFPDVVVHADPLALIAAGDIDLVVVATPNDTHAPLARAAISAGRNIVVDKPFTLDLDEARDLLALAAAHGVLLSVFHNRRWDSDFLTIRAAIDGGVVGDVTHFESHYDRFRPTVRDRWRERAGVGSGVWFDLGPHLVDQALSLFGVPDRVQGSLAAQRPGAVTDDWAHAILDYGDRRVVLQATMLAAGGTARFTVHGTGGSMIKRFADRQEEQLLGGMCPGEPDWGEDSDPLLIHRVGGTERRPALPGDQRAYYRGIAAALAGKGRNPVEPVEALAVMAVVEAVRTAAAAGSRIAVPLTDDERTAADIALHRLPTERESARGLTRRRGPARRRTGSPSEATGAA
ncbi:oxidoreductase [Sphingomonas mollis]|uniref:Oxidoreductase n=1 Tax=Sphingomonas mollis TaxID=2795726 RepID=A0ABS0XPL3_9SPHN|nr:oxidoreductase [Sphingomonas sp. BT553]MBJ6121971.1 oxidoreductase [Sphingomonas sp. BT553]